MTGKVFSMAMAFAYRRARKVGGKLWWFVLAALALVSALDRRGDKVASKTFTLRGSDTVEVVSSDGTVE